MAVQIVLPHSFLDAKNAKIFRDKVEKIVDNDIHTVIVDFKEVDYISSAGVRVLEHLTNLLESIQGELILCNLEDYIEELFEISGFEQIFMIKRSLNDVKVLC